jgi:hypothetical protein
MAHHRDVARSVRIRCVIDWLRELFDPVTKPWYREEFIHPRDFPTALGHRPRRDPGHDSEASARGGR